MHVNNDYQRNANLSRVFETVWKNPNFSRIDIARKLELYRSTVSNIIGTLVDSGLICEGERGLPTEKGGRKPVFLSVNPDFGCVIGIELQLDYYHVTVVSFDGNSLLEDFGNTPVNPILLDKPYLLENENISLIGLLPNVLFIFLHSSKSFIALIKL